MQRIERRSSPFFLNQHIIRVIGRNREDWNALRREWFDKREQHPRLREREWPMQLQAHPVMLDLDAVRKMNGRTHNGQFIPDSGDRCELALRRPFGHWFVRCLAHDGVRLSQAAEFELMSHENRSYQNCYVHPSMAFCTAARASSLVESNVGSGEDSGVTSKGISVQPRTTASQPSSFSARITST